MFRKTRLTIVGSAISFFVLAIAILLMVETSAVGAAPLFAETPQQDGEYETYTVQRGDTLYSIARRFDTTVNELARLNGIRNPNLIRVGQRLRIPHRDTVTPTPTPMPSPAPDRVWADPSVPIEVFSPVTDGVYHSPIEIIGLSRTFEGTVNVRLVDGDGEILAEQFGMGGSVDGYDFFHTYVRFTVTEQQPATLEVFEQSARDGSDVGKVSIPLILLPGQRFVDLNRPDIGQGVCGTISLSGYSNTFEANVVVALSQRDGTVIEQANTLGGNLGIYRNYSHQFDFAGETSVPLLVSAYELNGIGIGEIDHTRIPVTYYPSGTCP